MDSIDYNGFTLSFNAKAEKSVATLAAELGFASPDALVYVLDYGFRQALADPIAGKAKKLRDEGKTESEIEAALREIQQSRFEAILAGSVGTRASGPRLKPLDKLAFEQGELALQRAYAKASRKWPSGQGAAEEIRQGVAIIWEKYPKVREANYAEAERQLSLQKGFDDLDLAL